MTTREDDRGRSNVPPGAERDESATEGDSFKIFDRRFWAHEEAEEGAAEKERASVPTFVEQLQAQVEEKDRKLREYIAAYKKEVVENLEETKRRLAREAEQEQRRTRGELATPMVEVLDALERSMQAAEARPDVETLLEGLKRVQALMVQKLAALGLERIETVGQPFDPRLHDAVAVGPVDNPAQHDRVLHEVSAGFTLDGQVVHPARVQVGKYQA
jgi:molecular chaperone GrpE